MKKDRNSLGFKSLEGLERGNFTTKIFDSFHTYRGDRKKANRGVFKLLRLKSRRTPRNYNAKIKKRIQRCSNCKKIGHNRNNKNCSANVDLTDMIEEEEAEAPMGIGVEDAVVTPDLEDTLDDEELANIEDL